MTVILPPLDLETVLVGELEQAAALNVRLGAPGNARPIGTRLPVGYTGKAGPAVKLERAGGGPVGWPDHIDRAIVTIHAYEPDDAAAFALAAALVVALAALEGTVVDGGVITATERLLGPSWLPDPDLDNAPRYLLQYAVTGHPVSGP